MPEIDRIVLETSLYNLAWKCITAKQAKKEIKEWGYTVDLRKWINNTIEVVHTSTGNIYTIEI